MKANFKVGSLLFEVEGSTQKELFLELSKIQEVFGETECGLCKKNIFKFIVREIDGNNYFEICCVSCGAKLSLGQSKKKPGTLFPIRKLDKDGKPSRKTGSYGSHNGWTKYKGKQITDNNEE